MRASATMYCVVLLLSVSGIDTVRGDEQAIHRLQQTKSCPQCDLRGASLRELVLDGSTVAAAMVIRANLIEADLTSASLSGVHLKGALLEKAKLIDAHLQKTDLTDAILNQSDFTRAELTNTILDRAKMYDVNLTDAVFEPDSLPDISTLANAKGLQRLTWINSPSMLIALRSKFKEAGMNNEERQLTYAIMRGGRLRAGFFERTASYVFLELPTAWGVAPWRPLWILFSLIPLFAIGYLAAIVLPPADSGIWRVWDKDRIDPRHAHMRTEKLTAKNCRALPNALYFSILSAFFAGWHEVNVGSWISRMSPEENTLRSTGWVRSVSGLQSLISLGLLALWIFCYFGRPFE